ncbi:MAG: hypothetical protein LQ349_008616 [Xanthoria aureola]|nr:MAG: hypothetical protein LQ349_008616 [Xanthoria aureola]
MPVCTIYLASLRDPISDSIATLRSTPLRPLVLARVARWIIKPSDLSKEALLRTPQLWDLLLILPGTFNTLPEVLEPLINHQWSIQAAIPSRLFSSFESKNDQFLHPRPEDVPPSTGALSNPRLAVSSQTLELTTELRGWISGGESPKGAITMLNLLAFAPGMKDEYLKYGKAFAESIGSRRGGMAKIVGKIIPGSCSDGCNEWDEVALAHYPSLDHFADMLASEDYQDVNKKYRVPSLKDTCILCTSELGIEKLRPTARL